MVCSSLFLRDQGGLCYRRFVSSSILEIAPEQSERMPEVADHICPYFKTRWTGPIKSVRHAERGGVCHLKSAGPVLMLPSLLHGRPNSSPSLHARLWNNVVETLDRSEISVNSPLVLTIAYDCKIFCCNATLESSKTLPESQSISRCPEKRWWRLNQPMGRSYGRIAAAGIGHSLK